MKKSGIIIITILVVIGTVTAVAHRNAEQRQAYAYTDVGRWEVTSGDTLWQIAKFYSDNRHDTRRVIHDIYELNEGLTADLRIGTEVWVPLYDCMDWEYWDGE